MFEECMIDAELGLLINKYFKNSGYNVNAKILESGMINLCDFQCNDCFSLAKIYHQSPLFIAQKVVEEAKKDKNSLIKEITVATPGYINIKVSEKLIDKYIKKMSQQDCLGIEKSQNPKLYFLDYGGPNIAKPLHIGHLRSPIIGESIKRIIKFSGNNVICDVHFGDYGLQIGKIIYGLIKFNYDINNISVQTLKTIYQQVNEEIKQDENINVICADIIKSLQLGNKQYKKYWQSIKKVSVNDIKKLYKYIDVKFDLYEGESDTVSYIKILTALLNKKKILINSEGALVIDIKKADDKKELPPLMYQKSNGAYLYATTDMAAVLKRVNLYKPDQLIYIADIRQQLHFNQLFRAVSLAGIVNENKLEFHGFGTVNGADGKPFKTRAGDSPELEMLFEKVKESLKQNKESLKECTEKDLDIIVNSVIKFADLQNNREKDYIFDIEKFSKTDGKTGPYILYTFVRINKVVQKYSKKYTSKLNESKDTLERDIKLKLTALEKSFVKSFTERKPNYLASYVYDLCTLLNNFYEINRFSDKKNTEFIPSWLYTLKLSLKVIKTILDLLIIKIPKKM